MDPKILSGLAGVVYALGTFPYWYTIWKKQSRPSIASWLIWFLIDAISLAGMWAEHQLNGLIIAATILSFITLLCAFWCGSWKWQKLDTVCLAGALLGIVLWQLSSDATVGIVIASIVNIIGAIPTVEGAWSEPERENRFTWTAYWISCVIALASLTEFTLTSAAQPISFTIVETAMIMIVWLRPRRTRISTASSDDSCLL